MTDNVVYLSDPVPPAQVEYKDKRRNRGITLFDLASAEREARAMDILMEFRQVPSMDVLDELQVAAEYAERMVDLFKD